ncbi:hypothetical protein [Frigoribacterium sp. VKM Ac-2836]|uniref:hypothetical protein n=1 Tax=Frigoribacterium sp. VKM Ac-2836 TaxID=2739014 RepID=UPI001563657A|nr:hypothetical protein [Frigoribacterium sp. VKM Ac-2836]NRD27221.1 hypothetical protein [Frigoribacterium sp. VKM Ac-2836]
MSRTRALSAIFIATLLLTGCSTTSSTYDDGKSDEKMAGSLIEMFERQLQQEQDPFVIEALKRAVTTGSIPQADYDAAFDLYTRCMKDVGYADEEYARNKNGTMRITPPNGLSTRDEVEKYMEAGKECSAQLAPIESLFSVQQSNPDLIADPLTVATRCLAELGVTEEGYDEAALKSDLESDEPFPFDADSPEAQDCFTRVGFAVGSGQR